nr:hypothetical protein [uncultured Flavobacterium sp.]
MNKIISFGIQLIVFTLLIFGVHYILQQVLGVSENWNETGYNLVLIYAFQIILTIIMMVAIVSTSKSLANSLGYLFLGLLTLKCVANYFFIQPVLNSENPSDFIKHNFLIVFLIFLVFDVYVTFRILNQENTK